MLEVRHTQGIRIGPCCSTQSDMLALDRLSHCSRARKQTPSPAALYYRDQIGFPGAAASILHADEEAALADNYLCRLHAVEPLINKLDGVFAQAARDPHRHLLLAAAPQSDVPPRPLLVADLRCQVWLDSDCLHAACQKESWNYNRSRS